MAIFAVVLELPAHAQPQVGWQASFGPGAHNAAGVATILDENTIQVDNFTYDGGGIVVYFYLGATESSFANGLSIGDDLFGTAFDGTQQPLVIDLPGEQTIDGWNAISVWCVAAGVSFASGTFAPVDPVLGDYNGNNAVDAADYTVWRNNLGSSTALPNDDTAGVAPDDYDRWKTNFGRTAGSGTSVSANEAVPEAATLMLLILAAAGLPARRRRAIECFVRA
jgi:hypothetical protein